MTSVSRRDFLIAAGAASLFCGHPPAVIGVEDKSGLKTPTVGDGEFVFECEHDWGEVPNHITWRNTHGVALDRSGFVYIVHQGDAKRPCDTVVVFDSEGRYVRSFGQEFAGGGHGISIREEGGEEFLYLCDILHRQVVKCDLFGEWIWKKRYPRESNLYQSLDSFCPTNVAFGTDEQWYLGDGYGSDYVHRFDAQGQWMSAVGGHGSQPGQFQIPHGLVFVPNRGEDGQLIVADRGNARLQYFSPDGTLVKTLQGDSNQLAQSEDSQERTSSERELEDRSDGSIVTLCPGLSSPSNMNVWEDLMVVADLHCRLIVLDSMDQVVAQLGGEPEWTQLVLGQQGIRESRDSWEPGKFVHPHDVAFDVDGNCYVVEWVEPGRVSKLVWA
ncbi:peptidase [Thalassoglobus sp. JC818]|uniref:peptidase n=1 Tax=Thalassoglobus sp. JC818 TaxID=3232136 RepID=UPI0034581EA6